MRDAKVEDSANEDETWCIDKKDLQPSDRVVAPFPMSAQNAIMLVNRSKHMTEQRKLKDSLVLDTMKGFECARRCAAPKMECGFHFRTSDLSATTESNLVEWLYFDPWNKTLYYEGKLPDGGRGWLAEPLR